MVQPAQWLIRPYEQFCNIIHGPQCSTQFGIFTSNQKADNTEIRDKVYNKILAPTSELPCLSEGLQKSNDFKQWRARNLVQRHNSKQSTHANQCNSNKRTGLGSITGMVLCLHNWSSCQLNWGLHNVGQVPSVQTKPPVLRMWTTTHVSTDILQHRVS